MPFLQSHPSYFSVAHLLSFSNVAGGNGNGGAIYNAMYSTARVEYSQFFRNEAVYGGAIFGGQESTVRIIESKFESNKAFIAVSGSFGTRVDRLLDDGLSNTFFSTTREVPMQMTSTLLRGLRIQTSMKMKPPQVARHTLQTTQLQKYLATHSTVIWR